MRPLATLTSLTAFALVAVAPAHVAAFERQWHLGGDFGYALVASSSAKASGFGGGAHATYGLTDAFNADARLDAVTFPTASATLFGGSLGASYVLDVLRWVPHVGASVGAYDLATSLPGCGTPGAPPCHAARLALGVPAGLEYQLGRSFAVGVEARYAILLGGEAPASLFSAFARAEYVFGY